MNNPERLVGEKEIIWRDDNDIIHIKPNDGFEFDKKDVQRQFDLYAKLGLGKNNRALLLADGTVDFSMTKEARDLAAKKAKDYFIATAVISNSLSIRLLVNFLNSFYNFGIPIKLFRDEKDALKWLKKKNKVLKSH
ncbi:MAG TPA: STAS/SEC14 domain-containing protein [Bacteroidia bacterium]|nr:STAS/SEC14 domain-containing protein [Bacteroidia bacterium]